MGIARIREIGAGRQGPLLATTSRSDVPAKWSAVPSAPDILAQMSGFEPISTALPPTPDLDRKGSGRGKLTHSGPHAPRPEKGAIDQNRHPGAFPIYPQTRLQELTRHDLLPRCQ